MPNVLDENSQQVLDEAGNPVLDEALSYIVTKNPTRWRPESGFGYVEQTGSLEIVNKAGLIVVNKAKLFVVQNPSQVVPKFATSWTKTGKNATQWRPRSGFGYVELTGSLKIVNKAGLIVVTKAGLDVLENPSQVVPKNATAWTQTGI